MMVKSVIDFVHEVRVEFSKVIWPSFDEFVGSLLVMTVIVACFLVYLAGVDVIFHQSLGWIFQYSVGAAA